MLPGNRKVNGNGNGKWEMGWEMDEGARTLPEATCRVLVGSANEFVQSECKKEAGIVARHWERVCRRLGTQDGHVLRARTSAGLPLKLRRVVRRVSTE